MHTRFTLSHTNEVILHQGFRTHLGGMTLITKVTATGEVVQNLTVAGDIVALAYLGGFFLLIGLFAMTLHASIVFQVDLILIDCVWDHRRLLLITA